MTHLKPPYRDEADFGGFCHWDMNETQLREGLKLATQVKIHRVDPDFGSTLTVSSRDSQSNCWVN
jgi:hypothetical protein